MVKLKKSYSPGHFRYWTTLIHMAKYPSYQHDIACFMERSIYPNFATFSSRFAIISHQIYTFEYGGYLTVQFGDYLFFFQIWEWSLFNQRTMLIVQPLAHTTDTRFCPWLVLSPLAGHNEWLLVMRRLMMAVLWDLTYTISRSQQKSNPGLPIR